MELIRWVDFDKGDFIGRDAALKQFSEIPKKTLVTLEINEKNANASGYKPVWYNNRLVGFLTSGCYGHNVNQDLAMTYLEINLANPGTELTTHLINDECKDTGLELSPCGPEENRMKV